MRTQGWSGLLLNWRLPEKQPRRSSLGILGCLAGIQKSSCDLEKVLSGAGGEERW